MFSRLPACDCNRLSFTFYAVNYLSKISAVFMCEHTGSVARVTTTQYLPFYVI